MALPVFRRFTMGDIPDAPNWMEQIFNPLNAFCETTVSSLNKTLQIGPNVQGMKYTTTFNTGATGQLLSPIQYRYTGFGQPNCLLIGQITESTGVVPTTAITIASWNLNINTNPPTINVNSILGLNNNSKYTITLLAL